MMYQMAKLCCWTTICLLLHFLNTAEATIGNDDDVIAAPASNEGEIPPMLSAMGAYPNPLHITELERRSFHPVVKFPRQCWKKKRFVCPHGDYTTALPPSISQRQLLGVEEFEAIQRQQNSQRRQWIRSFVSRCKRLLRSFPGYSTIVYPWKQRRNVKFIGRYDEDRVIYQSQLFQLPLESELLLKDINNKNCTSRTVHVGIDLLGDVGTPVYALTDGKVHAVGYNAPLGDYGNVIVIEHTIIRDNPQLANSNATTTVVFYALYGHLDHASTRNKKPGDPVRRGQVLGWMGDVHECGGWRIPHVHFQLAQHAPDTHDMPGAVCRHNRQHALVEYWDPRYVLGELH